MGISNKLEPISLHEVPLAGSAPTDSALQLMKEHAQYLRQPQETQVRKDSESAKLFGQIEITGDDGKPLAKSGVGADKVGEKNETVDKAADKTEEKKPEKSAEEQQLDVLNDRLQKLRDAEAKHPLSASEKKAKEILEREIPKLQNVVNDQHEKRYEVLSDNDKSGKATEDEKKELQNRQAEHDKVAEKTKQLIELSIKAITGKLTQQEMKQLDDLRHDKAAVRCASWLQKDE